MNFNNDGDNPDFESYTIDYDKILSSKTFLAITKLTAAEYKTNPYRPVGQFFKQISDEDLDTLCRVCDEYADVVEQDGDFDKVPHFEEVLLIGEMLAAGEGVLDRTLDDVMRRTNQMMMYLAIESLNRKKLVKVYHDRFSFGQDAGDNVIVEKIEGIDHDDE